MALALPKAIQSRVMPWHSVTLPSEAVARGELLALQEAFQAIFMANRAPKGAGMFTRDDLSSYVFYFSPVASEMAKGLIERYKGTECFAPRLSDVSILVVDAAALSSIPFAAEP
jgi:hypothetical protein